MQKQLESIVRELNRLRVFPRAIGSADFLGSPHVPDVSRGLESVW
jgi:hypothetical protein